MGLDIGSIVSTVNPFACHLRRGSVDIIYDLHDISVKLGTIILYMYIVYISLIDKTCELLFMFQR